MKKTFAQVSVYFLKTNSLQKGTNQFAYNNLLAANKKSYGVWEEVELTHKEILSIIIPQHWHLVVSRYIGIPGNNLECLLQMFKSLDVVKQRYPSCYKSVAYWYKKPFSMIYLCKHPPDHDEDYRLIKKYKGQLIHLDGLHRLIGWGLAKKFDKKSYEQGEKLKALIAG